jgi:hypothetical protein
MGISQFDETRPFNASLTLNAASGLGVVPLVSGVGFRIRIDNLTVVNADVIDHTLILTTNPSVWSGGALGSIVIPAGTGFLTSSALDVLLQLFGGATYLVLDVNDELQFALGEVATLTNAVTITARGGLF